MGKQSAPPPPDYTAAAQATAAGNLAAAQQATAANRVNQYGPNGSLVYSKQTSPSTFDEAGYNAALSQYNSKPRGILGSQGTAPTRDQYTKAGEDTWAATQSYSPEQQALYDQQNQLSKQYGGLAQQGLNFAQGIMSNPTIDESELAQMPQNAGMSTQQAIMQRLQPQQDRERAGMDTQLANQGIQQGSEAWQNAKTQQSQGFNDQQNQAALQGINVDMQARNQGIANQTAIMNQPLNMINALRTGSQMTNQSYVNPAQQATTAGADYLGATNQQYGQQMSGVNAANAANAGMWGGLMGMGGAGVAKYSDRRTKEHITQIGKRGDGLNIYTFHYKPEFQDSGKGQQIGLMADEVESLYPEAVIISENGYKKVNYEMLGWKHG